jgi:hypothetical protein
MVRVATLFLALNVATSRAARAYTRQGFTSLQARQSLCNKTSKPNAGKAFWWLKRFERVGRYLLLSLRTSRCSSRAQVQVR